MLAHDDTIAAIATPPGVGGIGIVRVSGPDVEKLCSTLFKSPAVAAPLKSHHLYHGDIISPETGNVIDEVLIAVMRDLVHTRGKMCWRYTAMAGGLSFRPFWTKCSGQESGPQNRGNLPGELFSMAAWTSPRRNRSWT
jgi:hypothetical protein